MAALGLTRCPSLTQNGKCLGRAASLNGLRRSSSISATGELLGSVGASIRLRVASLERLGAVEQPWVRCRRVQ